MHMRVVKVMKKAINCAKWIYSSNCAQGDDAYLFKIIHVYEPQRFSWLPRVEEDSLFAFWNLHCEYKILESSSIRCLPVFKYWQNYSNHKGFAKKDRHFLRTGITEQLFTNSSQSTYNDLQTVTKSSQLLKKRWIFRF